MRTFYIPLLAVAALGAATAQEPAPRRPTAVPLRVDAAFATVSGARELPDGRILVTDARTVAVYVVDPKTGAATKIGSVGGDSLQYAQPGGLYPGLRDSTLLLDRGLQKVLVISPDGRIVASRSIARRGHSSSSDEDTDLQRVDTRVLAYFIERGGFGAPLGRPSADSVALLRFDPVRQRGDTLALLRQRETIRIQVSERMTRSRAVIGSPQDGWAVAPDGRAAVVRAVPYHVEWHAPNGQVTRGPNVAIDAIPFTQAERDSLTAAAQASGGSVVISSGAGGEQSSANAQLPMRFTETKAPFDEYAAIASPDGRVWVQRTRPFRAATVVYDVFDERGVRVDRIELPARSRVIGFAPSAIFVNERDAAGKASLKKYKL